MYDSILITLITKPNINKKAFKFEIYKIYSFKYRKYQMFKPKNSNEIKTALTKIFKEYEKNLKNRKINSIYLNDSQINVEKINLNIDINIKKENYIGLNRPINKMKLKLLKLKKL